MHAKKLSIFSLVTILFSFFGTFIASACGCGMMITSNENNSWTYGDDSDEQSFINLENGTERLIISLNIKKTARDAVLVIPVPAVPNSVKADVLAETPVFSGYNVSEKAKKNLKSIRDALLLTQFYPAIPMAIFTPIGSQEAGNLIGTKGLDRLNIPTGAQQEIVVYQHLEKEGMVAEVLTAATSNALYDYLKQKGLNVEQDSIPVFRDYIRNDFSFVVSWINPSEKAVSAKGLLMTFPAEKIYYPLKPGSAYAGAGSEKIINIMGYVSPKLFSNIKKGTEVKYYYSSQGSAFKDFNSLNDGFGFTKIKINVAPDKLTEDLYISNTAPLKILNAHFINLHPVIYGLILLIFISFIATSLATIIISKKEPINIKNVLKMSLINSLTLIGVIIASKIYKKNDRIKFVFIYTFSFVILTLLIIYDILLFYK